MRRIGFLAVIGEEVVPVCDRLRTASVRLGQSLVGAFPVPWQSRQAVVRRGWRGRRRCAPLRGGPIRGRCRAGGAQLVVLAFGHG